MPHTENKILEYLKTSELIPHACNARNHTEAQVSQIAASIREFGFTTPILIRDDQTIISGHGRLLAAQQLNMETVPCIRLEHLSKTQARALSIVDNQLTINSDWDLDFLKLELETLKLEEFNLDILGLPNVNDYLLDDGCGDSEKEDEVYEALAINQKPIFSYYGGKQRLVSRLLPLIPKHTVFVEPFCGGATVFFAKPWPDVENESHYREVLNDLNEDIFNLYKCFQDKELAEKLIHRLEFTLYSRKECELRKEKEINDKAEKAARFYCDVNMSFNNVVGSGWGTGVYGRNMAASWANKISRLKDYFDRMSAVSIECIDAVECIKKWDSPQTFFYLDPPYVGTNQGHYSGYAETDLQKLVETLDNADGSFLLSSYDTDIINCKGWKRFEFESHCSADPAGRTGEGRDKSLKNITNADDTARTEIVWKRNNKIPVREEIQLLYDSGAYDCFPG